MERKHEAMLQMYGEKAEEAEELKLDILDLKAVYRQQVNYYCNVMIYSLVVSALVENVTRAKVRVVLGLFQSTQS